jgi:hypothetical protein
MLLHLLAGSFLVVQRKRLKCRRAAKNIQQILKLVYKAKFHLLTAHVFRAENQSVTGGEKTPRPLVAVAITRSHALIVQSSVVSKWERTALADVNSSCEEFERIKIKIWHQL